MQTASRHPGRLVWLACLVPLLVSSAPPSGAASTGAQPAPTATPGPVAVSLSSDADIPPLGVRGLLSFATQGGDDSCVFSPGPVLPGTDPDCVVTIPQDLSLYFAGFAPNQDVDVEVAPPEGTLQRRLIRADAEGYVLWQWLSLPGDPLGVYAVRATAGGREATGSFTVEAAPRPEMLVHPEVGPPGTTFRIALAGFEPHRTVPLRLYRHVGYGVYEYVTSLQPAGTDERGETIAALSTAPDDPEREYALETDPSSAHVFKGRFAVTRAAVSSLRELADVSGAGHKADLEAAMLAVVVEANRVLASAVAKDGAPLSDLDAVYVGRALAAVRADVAAMRARGHYRDLRPTAPFILHSVRYMDEATYVDEEGCNCGDADVVGPCDACMPRLDVLVSEQWEDRLYSADGSPLEASRARELWRYVVKLYAEDPGKFRGVVRYLIFDATLLRREDSP